MNRRFLSLIVCLISFLLLFSFPSICFSELKTVQGEHCIIVTGNKKDIDWKRERTYLRLSSIENGLKKITKDEIPLSHRFVEDIQKYYLEKFKVVSHTEKGRKICEKVQFTIDTEVLQKIISDYVITRIVDKKFLCYLYWDVNDFLKESIQKEKRNISIGIIVENKTHNVSVVENERFSDEIDKTFIDCLDEELKKTVKIIERRQLGKILEEHKLSVTGITDGKTVKIGKIENLDIIFLLIIYDDRTTIKLLKVDTGEVLLFHTYESVKKTEEGWISYGTSVTGRKYYYDKQSLTNVRPNVIRVWTKMKYSEVEKDKEIEEMKKDDRTIYGWDKLDHSLILTEVDCMNHTTKHTKGVFYNDEGHLINSYDFTDPIERETPPGSMGDRLLKKVCPK